MQLLASLAAESTELADGLIDLLNDLKVKGQHRTLKGLLKTPKVLWNKAELETKRNRLEQIRHQLVFGVLISIKDCANLDSIQQDERFKSPQQQLEAANQDCF
jgi:hypothetical protein